jgi:hypothetical protein
MAMMAKQDWHIMMYPNTLVARIFKARYFPHSSFLEANIENNPSYVWRSLWKSRHVLTLGCRWRIGDGSKIKVMHDPWLRSERNSWVRSPQVQGMYNMNVNELMLEGMRQWNTNKILQLFPYDVAQDILSVPLLDVLQEDCLVWKWESHRHYTVRHDIEC